MDDMAKEKKVVPRMFVTFLDDGSVNVKITNGESLNYAKLEKARLQAVKELHRVHVAARNTNTAKEENVG